MANLFPLFLKLEGRHCLVVGGGSIAVQKLDGLLSAGAEVHVVAPEADERIRQLVPDGQLRWSRREFRPSDLLGSVLVVAATGDPILNQAVFHEAQSRGVLCNAVDEPPHCNFYYPAVVRRGDLQIAISTAGHSPALAQRIRKDLERQFDARLGDWLVWLGNVRRLFFSRRIDPSHRRTVLHRIASQEVYERFAAARGRKEAGQ